MVDDSYEFHKHRPLVIVPTTPISTIRMYRIAFYVFRSFEDGHDSYRQAATYLQTLAANHQVDETLPFSHPSISVTMEQLQDHVIKEWGLNHRPVFFLGQSDNEKKCKISIEGVRVYERVTEALKNPRLV